MADPLRVVPPPAALVGLFEPPAEPVAQAPWLELERLYDLHADSVFRWAQRLGAAPADAQDVVQDVFLAAQQRLPSLERGTSLRGWLFGITRRVVDHLRQRQRRRDRLDAAGGEQEERRSADTPYEQVERNQELRRVWAILETLREKERTVIVLFEFEGLSGQEVAELMGMPMSQMWGLLRLARAHFLKQLRRTALEEKEREGKDGDG